MQETAATSFVTAQKAGAVPHFKQIQAGLLGALHFFPSSGISLPTILAGMMVPHHNNPTWSCSLPYQRNAILRQLFYNKIIVNSTGKYPISDYALNEQPFDFDCILKIIWEASNRLCQQRLQLRLASLILPSQSFEVVVEWQLPEKPIPPYPGEQNLSHWLGDLKLFHKGYWGRNLPHTQLLKQLKCSDRWQVLDQGHLQIIRIICPVLSST